MGIYLYCIELHRLYSRGNSFECKLDKLLLCFDKSGMVMCIIDRLGFSFGLRGWLYLMDMVDNIEIVVDSSNTH